ncbi:uncharacterized protein BDZ99DRAFT_531755 [Mytilinidion resinicola]|uniref:Zn(2)-C6 fungal-type domain-containing protein n=1 Tax=Mytilinidion resinicola TaxID=574789 RepID=A0A6A6YKU6_9PEZI|nr:uncharacterized protein BDZ99DRAFT_531755 [Mytilinidion resinicola]KAF2809441.1 hypothetical protein BDZ99DRAFT_531755 [Mytilinidion resinicola]
MDDSGSRKRPRPVVSCLRCREKKLKCDRITPCDNCVKAQCSNECTFKQFPTVKPKHDAVQANPQRPAGTLPLGSTSVEDLHQRVAKLEALISLRPSSMHSTTENPAATNITSQSSAASPRFDLGTLVVKGSRSRYHGQNDRVTLLNQFTEVKDFINNVAKDQQVTALVKQVQFLQRKSQPKITSPNAESDPEFSLALLKLREFLPPKSTCDRLVDIYCSYFERTMRILHIPTFMRQYHQIWTNTDPELCRSSYTLPQVTAVLAMGYAMDDQTPPNEDGSHGSYLKHAAIDLTQAWIDDLGRKHRTELPTIQVEVLLLLARSLRQLPPEKVWSSTGALVRSGMCMGLHVDPSKVRDISPFYAEMRRRLWATIVEMDLQASINAGMPIVAPDVDFTSLVPHNLDDSDFDLASTELPTGKPLSVMTETLAQVYLASSLTQRIKLMTLVQSTSIQLDLAEAAGYGRRIEESLSRKPPPLDMGNGGKTSGDAGSLLHRVLLDLYLRRPLLCLYRPILLAGRQDHPAFSEIQASCLESSLAILSYQDHYASRAVEGGDKTASPQENFFYLCCKNDVAWAALSVCQHLKVLNQASPTQPPLRASPTSQANIRSESTLVKTVEKTIQCLISRVGQRGSDLKDIMFLSIALQSVRSRALSENKNHVMYEGAMKALSDCRENLVHSVVLGDQGHPSASAKRSKTTPQTGISTITPPNTIASVSPKRDAQYPADVPQEPDYFLTGLATDMAAEFENFQDITFGFADDNNFNLDNTWNWDHMWQ